MTNREGKKGQTVSRFRNARLVCLSRLKASQKITAADSLDRRHDVNVIAEFSRGLFSTVIFHADSAAGRDNWRITEICARLAAYIEVADVEDIHPRAPPLPPIAITSRAVHSSYGGRAISMAFPKSSATVAAFVAPRPTTTTRSWLLFALEDFSLSNSEIDEDDAATLKRTPLRHYVARLFLWALTSQPPPLTLSLSLSLAPCHFTRNFLALSVVIFYLYSLTTTIYRLPPIYCSSIECLMVEAAVTPIMGHIYGMPYNALNALFFFNLRHFGLLIPPEIILTDRKKFDCSIKMEEWALLNNCTSM
jgi:hypothetical protein